MLPLLHRRVLITRAAGQASALAAQLEALGAQTKSIPTIRIAPPASWCRLDAALTALRSFSWVIFTSANAVEAFQSRARLLRLTPACRRVAAIGPATARAAVEAGIATQVDLVAPQAVAESLAAALLPHAAGSTMLLVRASVARDLLPETLICAGAAVTIAEAYRTLVPSESVTQIQSAFALDPPDAITFTSASTAHNLVLLMERAGVSIPMGTVLASIGPITSRAMRELNLQPTVEAEESSVAGLVAALGSYYERSTQRVSP